MDRPALTAQQRKGIRQALGGCQDGRLCRRLLALLDVDRGRPVVEVARSLGVNRRSVHSWVRLYRSFGTVDVLVDQPRPGRPSCWNDELRETLQELLEQSPGEHGYFASTWTVPLLQEQLQHLSGRAWGENTLRRELHALGYSWKRSRYVLAPDPERGEKDAPDTPLSGAPGAPERGPGGG